ncbi:hypothetical protein AAGW05_09590 [Arthrobacter sp. LAPM80]
MLAKRGSEPDGRPALLMGAIGSCSQYLSEKPWVLAVSQVQG